MAAGSERHLVPEVTIAQGNFYADPTCNTLRHKLGNLSRGWHHDGMPSRQSLEAQLDELARWKRSQDVHGLWTPAPLMQTATLDDGLGQGLALIRPVAEAAGLRVVHMGLMLAPQSIVAACHKQRPALLGLTVLQLDTEAELAQIGSQLPPGTSLVCGGAAFACDPNLAGRCNVRWVARDMAHFLDLLLDWNPDASCPA
jgi:hypothetical protein